MRGLLFIALVLSAAPALALPWSHMSIEEVIHSWGQPTAVHEPWKIMQQQELSAKYGDYIKDSPYAETAAVGRPSNPEYLPRTSTYVFDHPTVAGKVIGCRFEIFVDADTHKLGGMGAQNCPRACYGKGRPNYLEWLKGRFPPACEVAS